MDEQNWFGTSESGHLEALKVASGDNITLTVNKVEVSCAGIFRQMDYNIPSNEKWTIPGKDKLLILSTVENGDTLVYQKSAMNAIGALLDAPTSVSNGLAISQPEANRPDHIAVAEWILESPLTIRVSRAEGRYGIYSVAIVGGGL